MIKQYYLDVLTKHYADFSGCVSRKEYWLFVLWNNIVFILLSLICGFLGDTGTVVYWVLSFAVLIPALGMAARRLHDADLRAWWLLMFLIPVSGWLNVFIFLVLPSKPNRFQN